MCLGFEITQVSVTLDVTHVKDHPGLPNHPPGLQLDLHEHAEPGVKGEQLGLHGGVGEALGEAVKEVGREDDVELTGGRGHGRVDDEPSEQVGLQLVSRHELPEVVLGQVCLGLGGTQGLGVLGDNDQVRGLGGQEGQGRGAQVSLWPWT